MLARVKTPIALNASAARQTASAKKSAEGESGVNPKNVNAGSGVQKARDTPAHAVKSSPAYTSSTPLKNVRRHTARSVGVVGRNQKSSQRAISVSRQPGPPRATAPV